MSEEQEQPQGTPVLDEEDEELMEMMDAFEAEPMNKLKRSNAVIDLCDDEEEIAGLWGCPVCHDILDNLLSTKQAYEDTLRCTERYSDFGLVVRGGDPLPGSGVVLQPNQLRSRRPPTDRGVQSVRELPGQPAPKGSKKG